MLDNIIGIVQFSRPFFAALIRPIVFGEFLHIVRVNSWEFVLEIKDSATFLIAIFLFIGTYALVGVYLFRYSYEGYQTFGSYKDSFYNMLILMTTANFPDIMLPAYAKNYWYMVYFVAYLIIGLYFMMSFLLANVFIKFKTRLEQKAEELHTETEDLLIELFDRYDKGGKGYLAYDEGKEFFHILLNLDLKRKKHYMTLARLLDTMKITDFDHFMRDRVVEFFLE